MRSRAAFLAAAFAATAFASGCDSLPDMPSIDLSGWFDGNHGTTQTASIDVVQREPDLTLRIHKLALKDSSVDPGSNEITLHFTGNADPAVIADIQRSAPDWIAGTQAKDDTATIVASKEVEFSTTPEADGFDLILKPRVVANAAPVAAATVSVETDSLRGDTADAGGEIDGLQREGLRGAFGVDDRSGTNNSL
ncbi:MAG TPA: hypothetical protein VGH02_00320 [Rhizomicrobium sp.]|jgi:hypothetical protein